MFKTYPQTPRNDSRFNPISVLSLCISTHCCTFPPRSLWLHLSQLCQSCFGTWGMFCFFVHVRFGNSAESPVQHGQTYVKNGSDRSPSESTQEALQSLFTHWLGCFKPLGGSAGPFDALVGLFQNMVVGCDPKPPSGDRRNLPCEPGMCGPLRGVGTHRRKPWLCEC